MHLSLNFVIPPFARFSLYRHLNAIQFCSITIVSQLNIDDILPTLISVISNDISIESKYWFTIHYPSYGYCLLLWLTYEPLCGHKKPSMCERTNVPIDLRQHPYASNTESIAKGIRIGKLPSIHIYLPFSVLIKYQCHSIIIIFSKRTWKWNWEGMQILVIFYRRLCVCECFGDDRTQLKMHCHVCFVRTSILLANIDTCICSKGCAFCKNLCLWESDISPYKPPQCWYVHFAHQNAIFLWCMQII